MHYDEATGDIVYDDSLSDADSFCSESTCSPSRQYSNQCNFNFTGIMKASIVVFIFIAGFIFGKYDGYDKIKEWVNHSIAEYSASLPNDSRTEMENVSFRQFIRCCNCNAKLDVTRYKHLDTFDCICPECHATLRVELKKR